MLVLYFLSILKIEILKMVQILMQNQLSKKKKK